MATPSQPLLPVLRSLGLQRTVVLLTVCCLLPMLAVTPAQAQTFNVIHTFSGGADGAGPAASLTFGGRGTLYGTTTQGGGVSGRNCEPRTMGCGIAFMMTQHNGAWVLSPLYAFTGFNDGRTPEAPVAFGPGNLLYGSTINGGNIGVQECYYSGCGVVFTMHPPPTSCRSALCYWTETPIYQFASVSDGYEPMGNLAFDQAGNIYGATAEGGADQIGTVFQLTRSGASWTKTTVYDFIGGPPGYGPYSGVIIDSSGVLYGTASGGGNNDNGVVFELTPSGSGWTESVLYTFQNGADGSDPYSGLVMDAAGNLYGSTLIGGANGGGTIFELSRSGGGWTFSVIASLSGTNAQGTVGLALDSAGNLYGTTVGHGAFGEGNVFKLTYSAGQWTYSDLYDFSCGNDGCYPYAGPTLDSQGNIYGTARDGGSLQRGVVWEITP